MAGLLGGELRAVCSEPMVVVHHGFVPTALDNVAWPLRTARLQVRRAVPDDLDAVFQYRRLDSVAMWLTTAPEHFPARFTRPERLATTLIVELDGVVIGDLLCNIGNGYAQSDVEMDAEGIEAEIGWFLNPTCTGRGYATEATKAVLHVCFLELGLRRVTAGCFADNLASWRLMERLGMRREAHTVRSARHRSGRWLDWLRYALLVEEWRSAQSGGSA